MSIKCIAATNTVIAASLKTIRAYVPTTVLVDAVYSRNPTSTTFSYDPPYTPNLTKVAYAPANQVTAAPAGGSVRPATGQMYPR
jgi:hypothetical protein